MKDDKGLYYHPYPGNKRARMYVRETGEGVCFRLWFADDPELWKEHGWMPYDAILEAATMYEGDFDPREAYNIDIARELIRRGI
ncbi:hypothetical protein QUF72_20430 [Desulfobacterales bacterium HSG2]|nr:hypothetical protein [Desulfobacterales bacterium HSG2]